MAEKARMLGLAVLLAWAVAIQEPAMADWPMPGHDPQRTSASTESIPNASRPLWHVRFDALIPSRSQIITVRGGSGLPDTLYVTAADGIHALNPDTGTERWLYAMKMPPGEAPTFSAGKLFVAGTDRTVHAVDASTGNLIWRTDRAGAPFYVNPVVARGRVYAGSRDGYFYCFNEADGSLVWHRRIGAPISHSAAFQTTLDAPGGTVYFAADNRCAYALNAADGSELWSVCELPGGFDAYWPVLTGDHVLLATSTNYPTDDSRDLNGLAREEVLLDETPLRQRADGRGRLDVAHHVQYLTEHPDRRSIIVLDSRSGRETAVAPFLWWGNPGGQRYPPAIGPQGVVWAMTSWLKSWFGSGRYAGWRIGSTTIETVPGLLDNLESADEPEAYSIIGAHVYHNDGGDGVDKGGIESLTGGSVAFWAINTFYGAFRDYWGNWADRRYGNNLRIGDTSNPWGGNSVGWHGHQNPPVPLNGKVYFHRSNAVICMGP